MKDPSILCAKCSNGGVWMVPRGRGCLDQGIGDAVQGQ